jgi:hypothetical protein
VSDKGEGSNKEIIIKDDLKGNTLLEKQVVFKRKNKRKK